MKTKIRSILFACAALAGLSTTAFAASSVGPAAATKIATELFPAAGYTVTSQAAGNAPVAYTSATSFQTNDVLTFTLANGAVSSTTINLCGSQSGAQVADYIGATDGTNGVSTLVFRMSTSLAASTVLQIEGTACAGSAATGGLQYKLPQLANGASATIAASAQFGSGTSIPGAAAGPTKLYTSVQQFSMAAPTVTSATIDFATGLKTVTGGGVTAGTNPFANAVALADTGSNLALTVTPSAATVTLTLTGDMTGVARLCATSGQSACASTAAAGYFAPSGNSASISYAGTTDNKNITFVFTGTTPLTSRTVQVASSLTAPNGSNTLLVASDYFKLSLNSTSLYIPLVKATSTTETYIKLASKNAGVGVNGINVFVYGTNGKITTVPVTAITAGATTVITGTQLAAAAAADSNTIDTANGFPVTISVNAPDADIFAYAALSDAIGSKRIPVMRVGSNIAE